ncbi:MULTISPECIES: nuclear transport factor 2 family protein [Nocardia]|uniref:Nuclear transport factor 2 family protein n=2 Tax=Nocardia TaxID=1817 RepID=A0A2T2YY25_9NOCA|nr:MULTISPECIES: nuclear transport factor 2 family protein [Nocardia]MBF6447264.1 nuclear transport factor 2 family protein [Nocardia elegans]PSR60413.1 nuclear transport factor 2 family protein [Nocardia nova]
MSDINDLVERYLAVWNETDPTARAAQIADLLTDDAEYTDPLVSVRGHAGLDAAVAAVQQQFAGLEFGLGGPIDSHHGIARFTWHLGRPGEEPLVIGFDVAVLGDDGRLRQILGFLDKVPTGA